MYDSIIIIMTCIFSVRFQRLYSVSQKSPLPIFFWRFFPKQLGIFSPNFTRLLDVPIYAGLQIFIQLLATTIICSKCPSVETHWVVALNMAQWRIQLWADLAATPIDQNLGLIMAAWLRHGGKFSPKSLTFGHFLYKNVQKAFSDCPP